MDRTAWLLHTSNPTSRIIEIGPSYSPIAPKTAGWLTHVVDHASQAELRAKYACEPLDAGAIELVDTVWRDGPLHEAFPDGSAGQFDVIIASHVIEHLPDLAGFLASAAILLAPRGSIALAVPDRRFCFDLFKPATLTGDVLEARAQHRARHARRTVWNQQAYSVTMDGVGAWGQQPLRRLEFSNALADAVAADAAFSDDPGTPYKDCHAWHFTPAAFRLTMLELGQIGAADWRVEELESPWGVEFLCILRRGAERIDAAEALQERRMELLLQGMAELSVSLADLQAAATEPPAGPDPMPEPEPDLEPEPESRKSVWGALHLLRDA